ncbi:MAG: LamG-like jellyroll fold domain-containing protein, partial [Limisphaerales bacterium]
DGWGRLYLDGQDVGAFENWALPFDWQAGKSALTLGYSYTGWLDDVAVFNRALTAAEVRALHALPDGVKGVSVTGR